MHRLSLFKSFKWKLCLAVAAIILADYLFYKNGLSGGYIGIFAFGVLLCLVLCRRSIWQRWQGSVTALCALVFCGALILDPGPLAWTLFWVAISMAALFGMTTPYDDGWLWLQRLVLHGLRSPVAPFIDARKFARVWRKPRDRRFRLRPLVPILALPLGGSAVILILFATANPIIADTLGMIQLPNLSAVTPAGWHCGSQSLRSAGACCAPAPRNHSFLRSMVAATCPWRACQWRRSHCRSSSSTSCSRSRICSISPICPAPCRCPGG
jgi:hypothetical protein